MASRRAGAQPLRAYRGTETRARRHAVVRGEPRARLPRCSIAAVSRSRGACPRRRVREMPGFIAPADVARARAAGVGLAVEAGDELLTEPDEPELGADSPGSGVPHRRSPLTDQAGPHRVKRSGGTGLLGTTVTAMVTSGSDTQMRDGAAPVLVRSDGSEPSRDNSAVPALQFAATPEPALLPLPRPASSRRVRRPVGRRARSVLRHRSRWPSSVPRSAA